MNIWVYGLDIDDRGLVWFGTNNGVAAYDGETFRSFGTGRGSQHIYSLAIEPNGDVWAGTWGAGLSRFDGKTWRTFTVADGLPSNHVFALHTDEAGRLWIGTNRGLAIRDGGEFTLYGPESGLNVQSIFAIATSGDAVWVGGFGGVTWFPSGLGPKPGDPAGRN